MMQEMQGESSRRWIRPTLLLCGYGFFSYIKPSEPYITPFLMGPHKNLTEEEIVNMIFPVWSYSYTAFLIPIFLLTDYLRYKPIIMLQGVGYIACWLLLVFSKGVPLMKLMQVAYGLATACEIGYYSYIYSVVDAEHYQKATSYVRGSTLIGLFIGSSLSQILVSVAHIDYIYLNVISLVDVSIAFVISWFLPFPKQTLFFFRSGRARSRTQTSVTDIAQESSLKLENMTPINTQATSSEDSRTETRETSSVKWRAVLHELWYNLKQCYSSKILLRWSIWWALSTCGWILVVNYIQNLWETILSSQGNEDKVYNGAVESAAQMLGALAALSVGYLKVRWDLWGEFVLGFCSLIMCGALVIMYLTTDIWICYVSYIVFIALYNFVITISQYRIAVGLSTESFALVFGMNTFVAVLLNSLITLILIDDSTLGLDVNTQFLFYSGYFGFIGIVYLSHGLYAFCQLKRAPEEPQNEVTECDRLCRD